MGVCEGVCEQRLASARAAVAAHARMVVAHRVAIDAMAICTCELEFTQDMSKGLWK